MNITNLHGKDLKNLLKDLKKYEKMQKDLGKRGKKLFHKEIYGENIYKVEFFSQNDKKNLTEKSIALYKNIFGQDVSEEKILFVENPNLLGGIRIFFNDEMLDLSVNSIFKKIK